MDNKIIQFYSNIFILIIINNLITSIFNYSKHTTRVLILITKLEFHSVSVADFLLILFCIKRWCGLIWEVDRKRAERASPFNLGSFGKNAINFKTVTKQSQLYILKKANNKNYWTYNSLVKSILYWTKPLHVNETPWTLDSKQEKRKCQVWMWII